MRERQHRPRPRGRTNSGSTQLHRHAEKRPRIGRTPTSSTSEQKVPHAGHPWEIGSGEGKYSYYPGGDRNAEPKEAPSAVNTVVVPNVDLPKVRNLSREQSRGRPTTKALVELGKSEVASLTHTLGAPRQVQQVGQGRLLDWFLMSRGMEEGVERKHFQKDFRCVDRLVGIGEDSLRWSLCSLSVFSPVDCPL